MRTYYMTCGCQLKTNELKKTRKNSRLHCPKHPEGTIDCVQYKCEDCGCEIKSKPAELRKVCSKCSLERKQQRQRDKFAQKKGYKNHAEYIAKGGKKKPGRRKASKNRQIIVSNPIDIQKYTMVPGAWDFHEIYRNIIEKRMMATCYHVY